MDADILKLAGEVVTRCTAAGRLVATVESCTGGLVAGAITTVAGSSTAFERGFVTYSNAAKREQVGVPDALIEAHGAVSAEVAGAMAEGGIARSDADIAVAITGVAGPSGGTATKPVGLVHFACATRGGRLARHHEIYGGDRDAVRTASVRQALAMILAALD